MMIKMFSTPHESLGSLKNHVKFNSFDCLTEIWFDLRMAIVEAIKDRQDHVTVLSYHEVDCKLQLHLTNLMVRDGLENINCLINRKGNITTIYVSWQ